MKSPPILHRGGGMLLVGLWGTAFMGCRPVSERSALAQVPDGSADPSAATDTTMSVSINRRVWAGDYVDFYASAISPGGRYVTRVDWSTGDLAVLDLAEDETYRLTDKGPWGESGDYVTSAQWSPDGRHIAYQWYDAKLEDYSARVLRFDVEDGIPRGSEHRVILPATGPTFVGQVYGWTSENELLVGMYRPDGTGALALTTVSSGAVRVLKSFKWDGAPSSYISPDRRFIAYLRDRGSETGNDIVVLSVDGQQETPVVEWPGRTTLVGWIPSDGSLLFHNMESGAGTMLRVPMTDGRPTGPPAVVRENMPVPEPIGVVDNTLYYGVRVDAPAFVTARIDFPGRQLVPLSTRFEAPTGGYIVGLTWSPDGQYVIHRIDHPVEGAIHLVRASGEPIHQWRFNMGIMRTEFRWTPAGDAVIVPARDSVNRPGFIKIDLATGGLEMVRRFDPPGSVFRFYAISSDGQLYFTLEDFSSGDVDLIAHDLTTGRERIVRRVPGDGKPSVSPDGNWVALAMEIRSGARAIQVISRDGGLARTVYRARGEAEDPAPDVPLVGTFVPCGCMVLGWSSNSRSLLFIDRTEAGIAYLYRVAREGGEVERIAEVPEYVGNATLHPDGSTVAYRSGEWLGEIWALDGLAVGSSAVR